MHLHGRILYGFVLHGMVWYGTGTVCNGKSGMDWYDIVGHGFAGMSATYDKVVNVENV